MLSAAGHHDAHRQNSRDGAAAPAAALDNSKRSYLRVVSHELRTPLNSILGFSEILASELYGPLGAAQYREYAQIIRSSGEKLLKLVNELVEMARLQAGDIEMHVQLERLAPLLETLHKGFQDAFAARNLRLEVSAADDLEGPVDGRALRSVLSHLLQNAIAFSPDGARIELAARAGAEELEILVHNEGEGVDASELGRLLHPFEQGENALTRQGQGAGLGLAICDLTCRAMGGRLELASAPGEGFSARVLLPAR